MILAGLVAGAVVPNLIGRIAATGLGQRMTDASDWPDDVGFGGRDVLVIAQGECDLCVPLVTRSGARSVHLSWAEARGDGLEPRPGLAGFDLPPMRVYHLVADSTAERDYRYPDEPGVRWDEVPVPDAVDLVLVVDAQDFFVLTQGPASGLPPEDARRVVWSLHLYEVPSGRMSDLRDAVPLGRLLQARMSVPGLGMPIFEDSVYVPGGDRLDAVASRTICGADAAPDCVRFFP